MGTCPTCDHRWNYIKLNNKATLHVSSGDLAVKHSALGAKGHRFDPSKEVETFPEIHFSAHYIVGGWPR